MLVKEILLTIIGLSGGMIVAGGLFGFIVSLGVISDLMQIQLLKTEED